MTDYRDAKNIDPNIKYPIYQIPKFIREKMYGVDVREAIAQGIERTYKDASKNGNANMEVEMARGTEPTLNDRLDKMDDKDAEVTAQLAEKANNDYVTTLINTIQGGGPKDVFYNLAALQSTFPNGTAGTYLVLDTDPSYPHLYGWSSTDNTWIDLGAYNSTLQEVINARQDRYGTTFPTLKSHTDNIENTVSGYIDKKFKCDWAIGDNSSATGGVSYNTKRVTQQIIQYADVDLFISTDWSQYKIYLWEYSDASATSPNAVGWKINDFVITYGTYYKLVLARLSEIDISDPRESMFQSLQINTLNTLGTLKSKSDGLSTEVITSNLKYAMKWVIGDITGGSPSYNNVNGPKRMINLTIQQTNLPLQVSTDWSQFRIYLWLYDATDGTNPTGVGWINSDFVIPKNECFRLVLARIDGNEIALAYTDTSMLDKLKIAKYSGNNLKYNAKWVIADINSSGAIDSGSVNATKRIAQNDILKAETDMLITFNSNLYRVYLYTFDDSSGTNPTDGYWQESGFYILQGTYYRLLIARKSDNEIDVVNNITDDLFKNISVIDCSDEGILNDAVKSINHRGYNTVAPENTLPAFTLAAKKGFKIVETDISLTNDGVPVLLHDSAINRTARKSDGSSISGVINISDITYATALTYDFGIFMGNIYKGVKIQTVEEFIQQCKNLGLHAYMELKDSAVFTQQNVDNIVSIVKKYGMLDGITWESSNVTYLQYVLDAYPKARICLITNTISSTDISDATNLKNDSNEVFIFANYQNITDSLVNLCIDAGIPLEVWTVNFITAIKSLHPYISGVASDKFKGGNVLYQKSINI